MTRPTDSQPAPPSDGDATPTRVLIERIEDGDSGAFDQLYQRYHQRILQSVRVRLGPKLRRRLDSMDVFQSSIRDALSHLDQLRNRSEGMFLHWISAIVRNKIRNKFAHYKAQRRDLDQEQVLASSADPMGGETPSRIVAGRESTEAFLDCLDELPEREREVLILKRIEKLTWAEIGAQLDIPERTAQNIDARARVQLLTHLKKRGLEMKDLDAL